MGAKPTYEELEQKVAELRQYEHIVESTDNPIGMVDPNFIYRYVNEPYCQALNKSRHEIIGHTVSELFGRRLFETVMKPHYKRCFAGENVDYQTWFQFPGWGRRYMDVRYYPFRAAGGQVTAAVTNVHDITEIKDLDMKLSESQERFRAFMDNIPGSVYIKDEDDRHIYGNLQALESVGKTPEEFIGSTTRDLWPPQLAERLAELDHQVMRGETPRVAEEWRNTEEGDTRWRRDIKFPITLRSGKRLLGGIAIDITSIKENEQRLQNAYSEIKQLKQELEQENIYLREEIKLGQKHEEIIGQSMAMKSVLSQAEQVAGTDSSALILGETGTGKELLARSIHRMSSRRGRPLVRVNCAALPSTLIESELFGRVKGAYTGALSKEIGRFKLADGATIFLDEISEVPLEVQAKLLTVLQEGQFEPLGSSKTTIVDVRVIAATNQDLARAVRAGRFREDLYYRLNVFPISMPPLRERREDIPLLVWAFVQEFCETMGKKIESISKKNMELLQEYSWPGNVRELRNVIERAIILCKGSKLIVELPATSASRISSRMALKEVEKQHIEAVLRRTGWRVRGQNGAAQILGLKPTTLDARIKKLGIQRRPEISKML